MTVRSKRNKYARRCAEAGKPLSGPELVRLREHGERRGSYTAPKPRTYRPGPVIVRRKPAKTLKLSARYR